MVAGTPLGRIGQPDDIARVAVFLPQRILRGSETTPSLSCLNFFSATRAPFKSVLGTSVTPSHPTPCLERKLAFYNLGPNA
jgi:hypothetical protein